MYACVCKYVCMVSFCICMYVGVLVATRLAFKNKQNYVNGNRWTNPIKEVNIGMFNYIQ